MKKTILVLALSASLSISAFSLSGCSPSMAQAAAPALSSEGLDTGGELLSSNISDEDASSAGNPDTDDAHASSNP